MKKIEVPHVEIRRTKTVVCDDVDVTQPLNISVIVKLLQDELQGLEQESFVIVAVGGDGRPIGIREVARGHADHVSVPTREMFRTALLLDARAIVLAHNHPSGNPTPSEADQLLTMRLRAAGEMINMPILDHIIIGEGERYFSMAKGDFMSTATMNVSGDREPPEF